MRKNKASNVVEEFFRIFILSLTIIPSLIALTYIVYAAIAILLTICKFPFHYFAFLNNPIIKQTFLYLPTILLTMWVIADELVRLNKEIQDLKGENYNLKIQNEEYKHLYTLEHEDKNISSSN